MSAEDISSVHLTAEFLRGVRAAAEYAHAECEGSLKDEIIEGTIAAAVRAEGRL